MAEANEASAAAETFLDEWMEFNIAYDILHPDATTESLRKRCLRDARLAGIPASRLEGVVGELELAIGEELAARKIRRLRPMDEKALPRHRLHRQPSLAPR